MSAEIEIRVGADQVRPGDQMWTRTWYASGMQPSETSGWRKVAGVEISERQTVRSKFADGWREVTVGGIWVVLTMGDDLGPAVIRRWRGAEVRVRRG